jgi:hypothetical protein
MLLCVVCGPGAPFDYQSRRPGAGISPCPSLTHGESVRSHGADAATPPRRPTLSRSGNPSALPRADGSAREALGHRRSLSFRRVPHRRCPLSHHASMIVDPVALCQQATRRHARLRSIAWDERNRPTTHPLAICVAGIAADVFISDWYGFGASGRLYARMIPVRGSKREQRLKARLREQGAWIPRPPEQPAVAAYSALTAHVPPMRPSSSVIFT